MYGYMLPNLSPSPNLYKVQRQGCLQTTCSFVILVIPSCASDIIICILLVYMKDNARQIHIHLHPKQPAIFKEKTDCLGLDSNATMYMHLLYSPFLLWCVCVCVCTGDIVLYNVFYEIFSVCTSIIGQTENGTLLHARNLDFGLLMGYTCACALFIHFCLHCIYIQGYI